MFYRANVEIAQTWKVHTLVLSFFLRTFLQHYYRFSLIVPTPAIKKYLMPGDKSNYGEIVGINRWFEYRLFLGNIGIKPGMVQVNCL